MGAMSRGAMHDLRMKADKVRRKVVKKRAWESGGRREIAPIGLNLDRKLEEGVVPPVVDILLCRERKDVKLPLRRRRSEASHLDQQLKKRKI